MQGVTTAREVHALIRTAIAKPARVNCYTNEAAPGAEFGIRLLEPGVTVLTGESAIGLEFESVFLQDLTRSLPCKTEMQYRRMYMLCARARNSLILVNGPDPLSAEQIADLPPPKLLSR